MPSLLKVILPMAAAPLVFPAVAWADPAISVDRSCYATASQRPDVIRMAGSGFTPGAAFQVTIDGRPLAGATGTVDAAGAFTGALAAPELDPGTREHAYTLGVTEGEHSAAAPFSVARVVAAFRPSAGDPGRLRVAFDVVGFALSGRTAPPVYLHYVRPSGRLLYTVRLGTGSGPCGSLQSVRRRRLFPFPAPAGTWRLQFDTDKAYRKGSSSSTFLFFTVTVKVRGR